MANRQGRIARLRAVNRTQAAIIVATSALFVSIFFPRLYPAARSGPECTDLAQPIGGNNRSILAYRSDQIDSLDLALDLTSRTIGPNGNLEISLTFINQDRGPVILHIPGQRPILTDNPAVEGITFKITSTNNAVPIASQPGGYTPPATFVGADFETLHLLGSRARCHETITIDAETLRAIGVVAGNEYRIQAYYRNSSPGNLVQANNAIGIAPTATPFPEFADTQGVWTGTAASEEVLFRVSTAQPIPPQ